MFSKNLRHQAPVQAAEDDMITQFETGPKIQFTLLVDFLLDSMYEDDFDALPGRVIEHKWRPCRFKNATFCMVCGKLISSLGECPEEIPSDRTGFLFCFL